MCQFWWSQSWVNLFAFKSDIAKCEEAYLTYAHPAKAGVPESAQKHTDLLDGIPWTSLVRDKFGEHEWRNKAPFVYKVHEWRNSPHELNISGTFWNIVLVKTAQVKSTRVKDLVYHD